MTEDPYSPQRIHERQQAAARIAHGQRHVPNARAPIYTGTGLDDDSDNPDARRDRAWQAGAQDRIAAARQLLQH